MYYEAALLDTSVLQSILKKDVKRTLMQDNDDANLQKLRANEYETLARFCVEKKEWGISIFLPFLLGRVWFQALKVLCWPLQTAIGAWIRSEGESSGYFREVHECKVKNNLATAK